MAAATILEAGGDYRRQQLLPYASRLVAPSAMRRRRAVDPAFLRNFSPGYCWATDGLPAMWCWIAGFCTRTREPCIQRIAMMMVGEPIR